MVPYLQVVPLSPVDFLNDGCTKSQHFFILGVASDLFGRKRSLLFSGFLFLLSWVLIFPHNIWTTYTSRFIGGFSIGWTTSIIPVYLSEIATVKKMKV